MALSFIEHSLQPAAVLPSLADMLRVTNTNPATLDAAAEQNPILTIDGDALLTYLTSNLAPGDELLVSGVPGSAPDLDLGSVRVQLVRMLGEGDNGAVCLAKVQEMAGSCLEGCLPGNRLVVMKVPATWLWAQDLQPPAIAFKLAHAALAIRKEFITMRHCSKCPHIVQTFGLGVVQHVNKPGQCIQLPVLLSEFCELGSWEDLLFVDNSPMHSRIKQDPATVWFLMKQVVPALTHMNNLKILHKDVRPSCILLQGSSLGCCAAGAPPDTAFSSLHAAYPFIVKLGGFGCSSWEPIGMCDVKCAKVSAYHAPEVGCHEEGLNISAWVSLLDGLGTIKASTCVSSKQQHRVCWAA